MRAALLWVVILLSLSTWAGPVRAQAFENTTALTLGVGALVPVTEMSKAYGLGFAARLGLRMSISAGTSIGVETGFYAPNRKSGNATLYQCPVRVLLYFPLAPEGSSTPYVALGPGVTFSQVGDSGDPDSPTKRDPYFTYALKLGWAFRPEQMSGTVFEVGARFEHQFIGGSPDFQTVDVEVCVGRVF